MDLEPIYSPRSSHRNKNIDYGNSKNERTSKSSEDSKSSCSSFVFYDRNGDVFEFDHDDDGLTENDSEEEMFSMFGKTLVIDSNVSTYGARKEANNRTTRERQKNPLSPITFDSRSTFDMRQKSSNRRNNLKRPMPKYSFSTISGTDSEGETQETREELNTQRVTSPRRTDKIPLKSDQMKSLVETKKQDVLKLKNDLERLHSASFDSSRGYSHDHPDKKQHEREVNRSQYYRKVAHCRNAPSILTDSTSVTEHDRYSINKTKEENHGTDDQVQKNNTEGHQGNELDEKKKSDCATATKSLVITNSGLVNSLAPKLPHHDISVHQNCTVKENIKDGLGTQFRVNVSPVNPPEMNGINAYTEQNIPGAKLLTTEVLDPLGDTTEVLELSLTEASPSVSELNNKKRTPKSKSPEAVQKIPEKEIANKNEEKMKELMTTIKSLERALSSSLNLQTKLKRTSLETQKKLVTAERELQEQKKENATMKENKSLSTEKILPELTASKQKVDDLNQKITLLTNELNTKNESSEKFQSDFNESRTEIDALNQKITLLTNELNTKNESSEKFQSDFNESRTKIDALNRKITQLTKELNTKNENSEKFQSDFNESRTEIDALNRKITQLTKELNSKNQSLENFQMHMNVSRREVEISNRKITQLTKELNSKNQSSEKIQVHMNVSKREVEILNQQIALMTKELNANNENFNRREIGYTHSLKEQSELLKTSMKSIELNKQRAIEADSKCQILEKELKDFKAKSNTLEEKIQFLENGAKDHEMVVQELSQTKESLKNAEGTITSLQQEKKGETQKSKSLGNIIQKQNNLIALLQTEIGTAKKQLAERDSELTSYMENRKIETNKTEQEMCMTQVADIKRTVLLSEHCDFDTLLEKLKKLIESDKRKNELELSVTKLEHTIGLRTRECVTLQQEKAELDEKLQDVIIDATDSIKLDNQMKEELLRTQKAVKQFQEKKNEVYKQVTNLTGKLHQRENEIRDYEEVISSMKKTCEQHDQEAFNTRRHVQQQETELEQLKDKLLAMKSHNDILQQKLSSVEHLLVESEKYEVKYQNAERIAHENEETISSLSRRSSALEKELMTSEHNAAQLREAVVRQEKELTSTKMELQKCEHAFEKNVVETRNLGNQKENQIRDYEEIISSLKAKNIEQEKEVYTTHKRVQQQETELKQLKDDLQRTNSDAETLKEKLSSVERLLQESEKYAMRHQNAERTVQEKEETISSLSRRLSALEGDLKSSEQNAAQLKEVIGRQENELTSTKLGLQKSMNTYEKNVTETKCLKKKLAEAESYVERFSESQCLVKDYECLISSLKKDGEMLRQDSLSLIEKVKLDAQRRLLLQEKEYKQLQEKLTASCIENKKARKEHEKLRQRLNEAEMKTGQISKLESMVTKLKKEQSDNKEHYQSIRKKLQSKISSISAENTKLQLLVDKQMKLKGKEKEEMGDLKTQIKDAKLKNVEYENKISSKEKLIVFQDEKLNAMESKLQKSRDFVSELIEKTKVQNEKLLYQERNLDSLKRKYERISLETKDLVATLEKLEKSLEKAQEQSARVPYLEDKLAETEANLHYFETMQNFEEERNKSLIDKLQNELLDASNQKQMMDTQLENRDRLLEEQQGREARDDIEEISKQIASQKSQEQLEKKLNEERKENKELRLKLNHAKSELSKQRVTIDKIKVKAKKAMIRKVELENELKQNVDILKTVKSKMMEDNESRSKSSRTNSVSLASIDFIAAE